MVFQLRPTESREQKYPAAQDADFLGYDRPNDRWKVDASGIKIYASGIQVELDKDDDSVSIWSASGTQSVETWVNNSVVTLLEEPTKRKLTKKRLLYNDNDDVIEIREALVATPSGGSCVVKVLSYNDNQDVDYIVESLGEW